MIYTKKNFTLIELILVIALMALIMGVGVPAFNRISKGSAVSQAGRELAAKLTLARSYAIEKRTPVAVVFPTLDTSSSPKLEGKDITITADLLPYCNASYRMCFVYKDSSSKEYMFRAWVPETNWNFFPLGVVIPKTAATDINFCYTTKTIDTNNKITYDGDGNVTSVKSVELGKVFDPSKNDNNVTISSMSRVIIFKPNGQVYSPDGKIIKICLAEGIVDTDGKITATNKIKGDGSGLSVPVTVLEVNPYSGRVTFSYPDPVKVTNNFDF